MHRWVFINTSKIEVVKKHVLKFLADDQQFLSPISHKQWCLDPTFWQTFQFDGSAKRMKELMLIIARIFPHLYHQLYTHFFCLLYPLPGNMIFVCCFATGVPPHIACLPSIILLLTCPRSTLLSWPCTLAPRSGVSLPTSWPGVSLPTLWCEILVLVVRACHPILLSHDLATYGHAPLEARVGKRWRRGIHWHRVIAGRLF